MYEYFNKWTKISSLEIDIFDLKMMVKSGLEFFMLKFTKPFQPAKLPPGQFSHSGAWADIFALGSSNSEGARRISK